MDTWQRLGQHGWRTCDNYGWVDSLGQCSHAVEESRKGATLVWRNEVVESMPYGHHQIGVFE